MSEQPSLVRTKYRRRRRRSFAKNRQLDSADGGGNLLSLSLSLSVSLWLHTRRSRGLCPPSSFQTFLTRRSSTFSLLPSLRLPPLPRVCGRSPQPLLPALALSQPARVGEGARPREGRARRSLAAPDTGRRVEPRLRNYSEEIVVSRQRGLFTCSFPSFFSQSLLSFFVG